MRRSLERRSLEEPADNLFEKLLTERIRNAKDFANNLKQAETKVKKQNRKSFQEPNLELKPEAMLWKHASLDPIDWKLTASSIWFGTLDKVDE